MGDSRDKSIWYSNIVQKSKELTTPSNVHISLETPTAAGVRYGRLLSFEKSDKMRNRPDKDGTHRGAFEKNKKKIFATQTMCGICGKPVDFTAKYPHPLSPCIDHIIPIAKGGHPSDMENLQLAHWTCNRQKSDKLIVRKGTIGAEETISNRVLPQSCDWKNYRG